MANFEATCSVTRPRARVAFDSPRCCLLHLKPFAPCVDQKAVRSLHFWTVHNLPAPQNLQHGCRQQGDGVPEPRLRALAADSGRPCYHLCRSIESAGIQPASGGRRTETQPLRAAGPLPSSDQRRRRTGGIPLLHLAVAPIANTRLQYVGGFKGEWQKAPSGVNQAMKLELLEKEGVKFSDEGKLLDQGQLWAAFEV